MQNRRSLRKRSGADAVPGDISDGKHHAACRGAADSWHVPAHASLAPSPGVRFRQNLAAPWEDDHMTRSARLWPAGFFAVLLLDVAQQPLWAQSDQRTLGMRLFNQSCRVCHTKPQLSSPQYGPALSMNTFGGNAEALRQFISNGTPRMPGFKYTFKPAEIDAIVAYIKTIPAPAETAAPASGKPNAAPGAD
jgi:mono/diheme cytochrome c family protein